MKTVLVISVCLLAAAIVPVAFASKQSRSNRPATGTAGNWNSQKNRLITQLRQALGTARQSNDRELKQRLNRLTEETNALINELSHSTEEKDFPEQVAKLIEQLKPAPIIIDELSKIRTELTEHADQALRKAAEAVEKSRRSELGPEMEKLREAVEQFKREVASATTSSALESLRDTKLKELDAHSATIVEDATKSTGTWGNVAIAISLMFTALVAVVLFLTVLYFRSLVTDLEIGLNAHKDFIQALTGNVKDAQVSLKALEANTNRELRNLGNQIAVARERDETQRKPELIEPTAVDELPLQPVETEPNFPALVSDYLNHIGESRKFGVEAHFPTNILVPSSERPAPFMLIANDDGLGSGIVLPRARLQRGQDFSSLYKLYYSCAEPSAGDVYILSPATVERFDSGWRLLQMGRMEIH